MADVQFDEERYQRPGRPDRRSFLIRLVLSTGLVSTDKAAKYVLLGVAGVALLLMFLVSSLIGGGAHPLTNQDIERITQLQQDVRTR